MARLGRVGKEVSTVTGGSMGGGMDGIGGEKGGATGKDGGGAGAGGGEWVT